MQIELQTIENGRKIVFEAEKSTLELIFNLKANKKYHQILTLAEDLPNSLQTIMLRANMYSQLKQWHKLIDCCEKGISISPNQSQFYNLKGKALGKLGKTQEKIKMVKQAIKLNDQIPAYHRNLGAAYYTVGKIPEAILSHTKAIYYEQNNAINYHNRGSSFFRNKQYELAYKDFLTAVEKNPNLGSTFGWVADCAYRLGDKFQAVQKYTKAYQLTDNALFLQNKLKIESQIKAEHLNSKKKGKLFKIF